MRSLPSSTQSHVKSLLGPCALNLWRKSIHFWICLNRTYQTPQDTAISSVSRSIWRLNKLTHLLLVLILRQRRTPERHASTLWPSPATSIFTRTITRLRSASWLLIHGMIWSSRLVVTAAHHQMFAPFWPAIFTSPIAGTFRTSRMASLALWPRKWLRSLRKPQLIIKNRRMNRTLSFS